MTFEESSAKLQNHANLPGTRLPIEESFLGHLWLADKNGTALNIEQLTEDIIQCLMIVNFHFNGSNPNEAIPDPRTDAPDHNTNYCVSCIITQGLRFHLKWSQKETYDLEMLDLLERSICKIAYAWNQVLAGDMSDVTEGFDLFV